MKEIEELESLGYFFTEREGKLAYELFGSPPDPQRVRPLLEKLRASKAETIAYLQKRPFTNHSKQVVILPADTQLGFPSGTWRRLEDGRIEACLSYAEMGIMLFWRDVVLVGGDGDA